MAKRPTCALFIAVLLLHQTWVAVVHAAASRTSKPASQAALSYSNSQSYAEHRSPEPNSYSYSRSSSKDPKGSQPSRRNRKVSLAHIPLSHSKTLSAQSVEKKDLLAPMHSIPAKNPEEESEEESEEEIEEKERNRQLHCLELVYALPIALTKLDYESQPENGGVNIESKEDQECMAALEVAVAQFCIGCIEVFRDSMQHVLIHIFGHTQGHAEKLPNITKKVIELLKKLSDGDFTMLKPEEERTVFDKSRAKGAFADQKPTDGLKFAHANFKGYLEILNQPIRHMPILKGKAISSSSTEAAVQVQQ